MPIAFSIKEAAALAQVPARTMRLKALAGNVAAFRLRANGGEQYRIPLDKLPEEAQARYWREKIKAPTPKEERDRLEALNLEENLARKVAQAANIARPAERIEPLPLTADEWRQKREQFEQLPRSMRDEAERRAKALHRLAELLKSGLPKMAAYANASEEFSESPATLRRWMDRVKNQGKADWYLMLSPDYKCQGAPVAELHPEAWAYIKAEWLVQSQPTITAVCRRAQREANRRGWGELPSIKTIKRRIEKELDRKTVVLMREGVDALERFYPAQQRDYSTLAVHDLWVSDGRKADVFVMFPDGEVRRPIVMAWMDVRTRKVLGWAVGKTENTPLVRASLRDAMTRSRALPREFLLDSGRAYASKEITGGQPNRYRFKVNEGDMQGVATQLNINVVWAIPGHGQSKPIESFWRTLGATDSRAEFAGAYCGNDPLDKPEEFDPKKAVPLALYLAAVKEDLDAYLERGHRGDSMNGESPGAVYDQLMAAAVVRTPTAEQLRMCLQAAETKTLHAEDRSVTILGNRYWCKALAHLKSRGPYTVRYDADDASQPVAVYDGGLFICEAPIIAKTGFRDQEAAKRHLRGRNDFVKATKKGARALKAQADAAQWNPAGSPTPVAPQAGEPAAAAAKVPELVATRRPRIATVPPPPEEAVQGLNTWAAKRRAEKEAQAQAEKQDGWDRRVAGAR
jgi:putative transposase